MKSLLLAVPLFASLNSFALADISSVGVRSLDLVHIFSIIFLLARFSKSVNVDAVFKLYVVAFGFLYSTLVFFVNDSSGYVDLVRLWATLSWAVIAYSLLGGRDDFGVALKYLIFAALFMSLYQVFVYLTVPGVHRIGGYYGYAGGEGLSWQPSYNEVGAFLALGAMASWSSFLYRDKKVIYLFCMVLCVFGVLLTGSRSSLLALVLSFLFCQFNVKRFSGKVKKNKFNLLVVFVFLAVPIFLWSLKEFEIHLIGRLESSFDASTNAGASTTMRLRIWALALEFIVENPVSVLIGLGKGSGFGTIGTHTLENFWLDIFFSYGLMGLLIVMFLIFYPLFYLNRMHNIEDCEWLCFKALFIILFVVSLTGNVLADPMLLSTYLVLAYSLLAKYKRVYVYR